MKDDFSDMQWHDNVDAAEIGGGSALDVDNILYGFRKVLEVKTSKGSLYFQKMGDRRMRHLVDEHRELLEKMTEGQSKPLAALEKAAKDRTKEDNIELSKFARLGRPWSMALVHASLSKPKMDLDTFYDVIATLTPDESDRVLETVASIYNPSEEAMGQAKRLVAQSAKFRIPIGGDLTMENAPPDLMRAMDEATKDEERMLKNVIGR